MLDSNLTGKDSYIEWLTGLAPAHKRRGGIRYRLLIFWTAATADLAGGMPTHVAPASILPADVACFICRIVAGEAPASIVLEDQSTMAFVDIRQPTRATSSWCRASTSRRSISSKGRSSRTWPGQRS